MPNGNDHIREAPNYEDSIKLVKLTAIDDELSGEGVKAFEKVYEHWERSYESKNSALRGKLHELESKKSGILDLGGLVSKDMEEEINAERRLVDTKCKEFRSRLLKVILSSEWEQANPASLGYELVGYEHYGHACKLFGVKS